MTRQGNFLFLMVAYAEELGMYLVQNSYNPVLDACLAQENCPVPLRLVGIYQDESAAPFDDEKQKLLGDAHVIGNWFRDASEIQMLMESMTRVDMDIHHLYTNRVPEG